MTIESLSERVIGCAIAVRRKRDPDLPDAPTKPVSCINLPVRVICQA